MSGEHKPLAPSAAHRWMNCAGSINFVKKLGDKADRSTSSYAAHGTVAHEVAAQCLAEQLDAWEFAGEEREADGYTFTVDEEMVEGVQLYLDTIRNDMAEDEAPHEDLFVEHKATLEYIHPDLGGTSDASYAAGKRLRVYDLKFGAGKIVEPEWNEQELIYAVDPFLNFGGPMSEIEEIELVIIQPRAPHHLGPVRRWTLSAEDFMKWITERLTPKAKATDEPDAPLQQGSWCDWCPAAEFCPEIKKKTKLIMAQADGASDDDIAAMEPWEIGEILALRPRVEQFFRKAEERAFSLLLNGHEVPGQKLVRQKANRVWKDGAEDEAKKILGDAAFQTEPKFLSPAKVEKIGPKGKKFATRWAFKPEGALTMASEDDKRPAEKAELNNPDATFSDML